jgi:hypothetical protein
MCAPPLVARDLPCYPWGVGVLFHRRDRTRPGAAFVVALVLLGHATAWVHAATPHVTCLEHGESVHLATGVRASAQALAHQAGGSVLASELTGAGAHGHEHCSVQSSRSTSAPTPHPTFVRTAPLAAVAPASILAPPAVLLLRLAPKTSPPRPPAA